MGYNTPWASQCNSPPNNPHVGSVSAGLVPGTVCEDWLEMVGGHQETAPPPGAPPPTLPLQLDPSLTPAPPWPGLGWISHIFPGLHKTFNFFLLQKKSPGPQATIIMVQCCSCAGNSGTGTLVMRNEGAYRRKHYSDQP